MLKATPTVLFLILTILVVAYIDNGIRTHDMDFYFGKDDGYITRFKSIILLTIGFYLVHTIGAKQTVADYLKQGVLGLTSAIIIGIISYLILLGADSYGLAYHIVTIVMCYASYFILKKITGSNKA